MAIYEVKREWSPEQLGYVRHFLLHNEADVKNLPACCVGSRANVSDTDNEYVYTVNGWMLESECEEIRPGGGTSGVDEVAREQISALSQEMAKKGPAIIDVTALPTDDFDDAVLYRLLTGVFYCNGTPQADWTCYVVESLPQEGEPVTTDMVHVLLYYSVETGAVSGYINSALSGSAGVPAGWYPVETLAQAFNLAWGGIIWDDSEDPIDGANRLFLAYHLYQYKQEWYDLSEKVGWRGEGSGGEVFNSLRNVASGNNSHAEGGSTTASGTSSHAEGYSTTASGNSSHAEGDSTTASGNNSHAEGYSTTASGKNSHAEGLYTTASGLAQHVHGACNIPDTGVNYLTIVGNGSYAIQSSGVVVHGSNAHTLDLEGNAWFAGSVYVGSTSGTNRDDGSVKLVANGDDSIILTSPNGTKYKLTVADDGTLTAAVV